MASETITLNSGYKIPIIGLGTWQASADECRATIRAAQDAGYRHFDTAAAYKNEEYIGDVLQEYFKAGKLKREDVFITTKLWATFYEQDRVPPSLDRSLSKLKLDYVDLFLVHTPWAFRETGKELVLDYPMDDDGKPAFKDVKLEDTWKGMEQCVKSGKAKSIGVSNFSMKQIDRICKVAEIKPCTNQILLRFLLQRGILVIPKSSNPKRLQQNIQVGIQALYLFNGSEHVNVFDFKLTDAEFAKLERQDRKTRLFRPDMFKGHPEYSEEDMKAGE